MKNNEPVEARKGIGKGVVYERSRLKCPRAPQVGRWARLEGVRQYSETEWEQRANVSHRTILQNECRGVDAVCGREASACSFHTGTIVMYATTPGDDETVDGLCW